jgi:hypothetical protein
VTFNCYCPALEHMNGSISCLARRGFDASIERRSADVAS